VAVPRGCCVGAARAGPRPVRQEDVKVAGGENGGPVDWGGQVRPATRPGSPGPAGQPGGGDPRPITREVGPAGFPQLLQTSSGNAVGFAPTKRAGPTCPLSHRPRPQVPPRPRTRPRPPARSAFSYSVRISWVCPVCPSVIAEGTTQVLRGRFEFGLRVCGTWVVPTSTGTRSATYLRAGQGCRWALG